MNYLSHLTVNHQRAYDREKKKQRINLFLGVKMFHIIAIMIDSSEFAIY